MKKVNTIKYISKRNYRVEAAYWRPQLLYEQEICKDYILMRRSLFVTSKHTPACRYTYRG